MAGDEPARALSGDGAAACADFELRPRAALAPATLALPTGEPEGSLAYVFAYENGYVHVGGKLSH